MIDLKFHHTGLLVESIDESLSHYSKVFGKDNISRVYTISSQNVNVCFVNTGHGVYLELVEPAGPDSPIATLLKKKIGYYHVAYKVANIKQTVEALEKFSYKALKYFSSEAFNGSTCIFLFTPEGYLVELIEIQ